MRIVIFLISIVSFFCNHSYGQQFLLIQKMGVVSIIDCNSYTPSHLYQGGSFSKSFELLGIQEYSLVGYSWVKDSLVIYLNKGSEIVSKKCHIDTALYEQLESGISIEKCKYDNGSRKYLFKQNQAEISISGNGDLKCFSHGELIWEKDANGWGWKILSFGTVWYGPVLSNNGDFLLLRNNKAPNKLIEVELQSGIETKIAININEYYYSSDDQVILISKPGVFNSNYFIYKKHNQETIELHNVTKAFWLLK